MVPLAQYVDQTNRFPVSELIVYSLSTIGVPASVARARPAPETIHTLSSHGLLGWAVTVSPACGLA